MHVLRLPVFDPIEVLHCRQVQGQAGRWLAVYRPSDAVPMSREVLDGLLRAAFKLVSWALKADAAQAPQREQFFQAIEKDVAQAFAGAATRGKSTFEVLRAAGLPAPVHAQVRTLDQARAAAQRLGFPLVVKPADQEGGEGVAVDVDAPGLEAAFEQACKCSPTRRVLVERQVPGVCHRLFIAAGRLLYAVRRLPMGVYADARSSIAALVEAECGRQQGLPPWKRPGRACRRSYRGVTCAAPASA